ncbi:hypothetical protein C496_20035 [Natronorubrum tibetense GA33]|uniref:Uncharacterized protein n=1 Tax=Natronorubrum tibetense GA33 TaxID=1114856 RepID=L9VLH5_9EURY|nr:hypothetical protein C496_20035 [Natronorubrum tibetense GA33]
MKRRFIAVAGEDMSVDLVKTGVGQSTGEPFVQGCCRVVERYVPRFVRFCVLSIDLFTGQSVESGPSLCSIVP